MLSHYYLHFFIFHLNILKVLIHLMTSGTRPSLPDETLTEDYLPVLEIFYVCTEAEPAKRPKASQVVSILDFMGNKKEKTEGKTFMDSF